MNIFIKSIENIEKYISYCLMVLPLSLLFLMGYVVFTRYALEIGSVALQELSIYLFGLVIVMSAGNAFSADDHVRIDAMQRYISVRQKWWIEQLGIALFVWPFCLLIILLSKDFVFLSWNFLEKSGDANGLPFTYIQKSFILIFPILLALSSLKLFLLNLQKTHTNIENNIGLQD